MPPEAGRWDFGPGGLFLFLQNLIILTSINMQVLFLDIDGVLNHRECKWSTSLHVFDNQCLQRLKHIIEQTGVEIVLSSSWRHDSKALEATQRKFKKMQIPQWIGLTANMGFVPRSVEIKKWLESNTGITKFVVIDDDDDTGEGLENHFFQTSFDDGGLTDEIAESVIKFLQEK